MFRDGLQKPGGMLNDPPVTAWKAAYQKDPIDVHALLLVANADPTRIDPEIARVKKELDPFGGRVLVVGAGRPAA